MKPSREQYKHFERVADMACMAPGAYGSQRVIHHCKGGSVSAAGYNFGTSQRGSHWLVIPLLPIYHNMSKYGIHNMGVESWEARYGRQIDMLKTISERLGYDVFERAVYG